MKVEIIQTGVYDAKGQRVPVGTELDVKGDDIPAWLVNKARPVGKPAKRTAVTNPARGAQPGPSAQERQALLKDISGQLKPDEFTSDGAPEVHAVNKHLPEGAEPFTAGERDQLWPGVKDG